MLSVKNGKILTSYPFRLACNCKCDDCGPDLCRIGGVCYPTKIYVRLENSGSEHVCATNPGAVRLDFGGTHNFLYATYAPLEYWYTYYLYIQPDLVSLCAQSTTPPRLLYVPHLQRPLSPSVSTYDVVSAPHIFAPRLGLMNFDWQSGALLFGGFQFQLKLGNVLPIPATGVVGNLPLACCDGYTDWIWNHYICRGIYTSGKPTAVGAIYTKADKSGPIPRPQGIYTQTALTATPDAGDCDNLPNQPPASITSPAAEVVLTRPAGPYTTVFDVITHSACPTSSALPVGCCCRRTLVEDPGGCVDPGPPPDPPTPGPVVCGPCTYPGTYLVTISDSGFFCVDNPTACKPYFGTHIFTRTEVIPATCEVTYQRNYSDPACAEYDMVLRRTFWGQWVCFIGRMNRWHVGPSTCSAVGDYEPQTGAACSVVVS